MEKARSAGGANRPESRLRERRPAIAPATTSALTTLIAPPLVRPARAGNWPFSRRRPSAIAPFAHALGTGRDGPAARFMAASGGRIVKTVAQLLRAKGHEVLSVSPELS